MPVSIGIGIGMTNRLTPIAGGGASTAGQPIGGLLLLLTKAS